MLMHLLVPVEGEGGCAWVFREWIEGDLVTTCGFPHTLSLGFEVLCEGPMSDGVGIKKHEERH